MLEHHRTKKKSHTNFPLKVEVKKKLPDPSTIRWREGVVGLDAVHEAVHGGPKATQNAIPRSAAPSPPTSTTGNLMLAPPTTHHRAAPKQHGMHGVGGGDQWQRRLVGGVVGGRVHGGQGHGHQLLLEDGL